MKPLPTVYEVRALLDYDPLAGLFRWRVKRSNSCKKGWFNGIDNGNGYRVISIDSVNYRAHRIAWLHVHGRWPSEQIDHINGNRSDNRIANLREASPTENARNRKMAPSMASGMKGVYAHSKNAAWCSYIRVNGRQLYLGSFATKDEAAAAYARAAKAYFGEFARAA